MRIREVEDFGAVARQRRRDLGLSQAELAQRAGVTRQWLVRFEQGNSEVALSKAFAVLGELQLAVRAEPIRSNDSVVPQTITYTIPKIDLSGFDTALFRRTLARALARANEGTMPELMASVRESLGQLNTSRPIPSEESDD